MARKAKPKSRVLDQSGVPEKPRFGTTANERRAEAVQRVQSIPSVDAGLSAPRGMSSPIGGLPLQNALGVDHSRLLQSPNVRPEDRAPNLGRGIGTTATRGHGSAAALAAEVGRHNLLFGSVRQPSPATVAVERRAKRMEDVGLGTDIQPRDKAGMEAKRQIAAIATPAGLKGDRYPGATGTFAGASETAITAAGLVEERLGIVAGMMKGSEVRPPRPDKVAKFGIGEQTSQISPKMKERLDTVTVSKGEVQTDDSGRERLVPKGRRTAMKVSEHNKRAEKRIAKRNKAEGES